MKKAYIPATHLFKRSALWAALSLALVGSAQAVTLARPVVQSKQGEALRTEIDVRDISVEEQQQLQAVVASPDFYKATKIDLPMVNGQPIDFEVQLLRRENGRPYLQVTSKQIIPTSTVDLLLDLHWATGRLIRDFTISLDAAQARSKPVTAPALIGETPATSSQSLTTRRGDTASELVVGKMPPNVSLDQMLLALLRNNPDAFVESNVNRMKEGALLTLPTEQEAQAISRDEARQQIQIQSKDFEAYRAELAARAPGGTVPKVARDSAGKLEAKVQNNNAKANQDKLTLAKPSSKNSEAEEKIAQQREAQDVADRAAELSRNIAELGKIAAATVGSAANPASDAASSGALSVDVPASAAEADSAWLDELRDNPLAPVGAGSLIAFLVLIGLWRRHATKKNEDDIQGLPPLNVKFNLDLPEHDMHEPVERAYIHDVATHMHDAHEHPHDHERHAHDDDDLPVDAQEQVHHAEPALRPTMEMPNISLDLDEADTTASPYQVRIDLADELWNLGQLHTSRALMEEVAHEASGADKEKALKWLAERA